MFNKAQRFNTDFGWTNGFGGGLVGSGGCDTNPFKGLDPATQDFYYQTKAFQRAHGLKDDGWFGSKTLERYVSLYGGPSLQVEGIDISGWQKPKNLNLPALKAVGLLAFAYVKAIEALNKDLARHAFTHTNNLISLGVPQAKYIFIRTEHWWKTGFKEHAKRQAENFLRALAMLPPSDLLECVDAEHKGYHVRNDGTVAYGQEMLDLKTSHRQAYNERITVGHAIVVEVLTRELGYAPLLYSYPGYLNRVLSPVPELAACPLWNSVRYVGSPDKYKHHRISDKWGPLVVKQWQTDGSDPRVLEHYGRRLDINQAQRGIEPFKKAA